MGLRVSPSKFPSANEAAGGAAWVDPDNAHADDGVNATALIDSTGDTVYETWWRVNLEMPTTARNISSVVVSVEASADTLTPAVNIRADINVGTTTVGGTPQLLSTTPTVYTFDLSKRFAWLARDLAYSSFVVSVLAIHSSGLGPANISLDYIKLDVTYETESVPKRNRRRQPRPSFMPGFQTFDDAQRYFRRSTAVVTPTVVFPRPTLIVLQALNRTNL